MIQSLLRSMELLEVLKEKNRNFSIAELAEAMDLPPSTVHRILQTFCEKKYVIRDDRSHTYRLGPALIPLGKAAARGIVSRMPPTVSWHSWQNRQKKTHTS